MTDEDHIKLLESEYVMVETELDYIGEKASRLRTRQNDIANILVSLHTKLALNHNYI